MSYNYKLAREIYGSPWMVDALSFVTLRKTLEDIRANVKLDSEEKLNSVFLYDLKSKTKIVKSQYDARQEQGEGNDLVYVVNLDGPITKNGGTSTYGTRHIAQQILNFDKNPDVIGGIMITDSGGGSTNAVDHMRDAMTRRTKPLVQLIEKGGMSASASAYIGSYTDFIFSESEDNIVGSHGTMITIEGAASGNTDTNGNQTWRIYATKSVKKNIEFEEVLNNQNIQPIIDNVLDPVNEKFLSEMKKNRPNILDSQLDGSIYRAGSVVGTLVDAIGTFDDAVNKVIELSNSKKNNYNNSNNNLNQNAMTAEELKSQHPATYNSIFNAGVTSGQEGELDRVGAWMAHASTDIEAVKTGISSGKVISQTQREEFLVKAASKGKLDAIAGENAKDLTTQESKNEDPKSGKEGEPTELDAFNKQMEKLLQ